MVRDERDVDPRLRGHVPRPRTRWSPCSEKRSRAAARIASRVMLGPGRRPRLISATVEIYATGESKRRVQRPLFEVVPCRAPCRSSSRYSPFRPRSCCCSSWRGGHPSRTAWVGVVGPAAACRAPPRARGHRYADADAARTAIRERESTGSCRRVAARRLGGEPGGGPAAARAAHRRRRPRAGRSERHTCGGRGAGRIRRSARRLAEPALPAADDRLLPARGAARAGAAQPGARMLGAVLTSRRSAGWR